MSSITLKDFQPWNQWSAPFFELDEHDDQYQGHRDLPTNRVYLYQDKDTLREKCAVLLIWSLAAHVFRIAITIFVNFYHFSVHLYGMPKDFREQCTLPDCSLKERTKRAGKDVLRILATPALVFFLQSAAFYGLFNPYDGRKLYASGERFAYEAFGMEGYDICGRSGPAYCAPCFQPNATRHALGGDPLNGNAW